MMRDDEGLTLVELLSVLLILGILATISTVAFANSRRTSLANACTTSSSALNLAITTFQSDNNGALPGTMAELSPTYLPANLIDQSGFTMRYSKNDDGLTYVLSVADKSGALLGTAPSACSLLK